MAAQSSLIEDFMLAIGADADITRFRTPATPWREAIPGLFAAGTERVHDTRALAGVWSDRAGFEKFAALVGATQSMAKAVRPTIGPTFRATFAAYSGCDFSYRGDRVRTP